MTNDRLERSLCEAIDELAAARTPHYLPDILERTSRTRQRPWWTFPTRYSMMSPTFKLATIGSLALLVGIGISPLLRSTMEGESGPPAADADRDPAIVTSAETPAERADPVQFEGRWGFGVELPGGEYAFADDGWFEATDLSWAPSVIIPGDPRLDGQLTLRASTIQKDDVEIWTGAFRLENDQGAWQQRPMVQSVKLADERDPMTWTAVFDGEGGYDGLTAVMGITRYGGGWDVEGLIIDGSLPPTPTAVTRE